MDPMGEGTFFFHYLRKSCDTESSQIIFPPPGAEGDGDDNGGAGAKTRNIYTPVNEHSLLEKSTLYFLLNTI